MNKENQITERHPIEPEELMAYLDGELPLERAAEAAAHLEHCRDCQSIAADLQGVSRRLMAWQVELGRDSEMPPRIVALLEKGRQEKTSESERQSWGGLIHKRWKPVWIGGLAVAGLALLMMASSIFRERRGDGIMGYMNGPASEANRDKAIGRELPQGQANKGRSSSMVTSATPRVAADSNGLFHGLGDRGQNAFSVDGQPQLGVKTTTKSGTSRLPERGPMIVRTAGLTLVTKEFEKTHNELERILKLHGGYVGQLSVSAPANSGRTLTATLRIPAEQLDAALAELKKLGRIENESQSGEDVTQRYVDLQARLANARNTEQQLIDILRNRTGKLSDVLEVEQELDRVRGEIEEMEAERKNLAHQVDFATLNMTLTEEFEKPLQGVPISTLTRVHNAAVEGYTSMVDGLVSVILFLFSVGPTLLLWGAILFFPARAVWRRWRARAA